MTSLIELIGTHPHLGVILEEWGIDYCFYAEQTLLKVCQIEGIDYDEVVAALERAGRTQPEKPPTVAPDYSRIRQQIPGVRATLDRARQLHSPEHMRLANIALVFDSLCSELDDHMFQAEMFVLPWIGDGEGPDPWILELFAAGRRRMTFRVTCLRVLCNNFRAPSTYDPSLDRLYLELRRLEKTWVQQAYLEENLVVKGVAA